MSPHLELSAPTRLAFPGLALRGIKLALLGHTTSLMPWARIRTVDMRRMGQEVKLDRTAWFDKIRKAYRGSQRREPDRSLYLGALLVELLVVLSLEPALGGSVYLLLSRHGGSGVGGSLPLLHFGQIQSIRSADEPT